jgi:peroxiredoxin
MASRKQNMMLEAGTKAPDFELLDLGGNRLTLTEIAAGQPLTLVFFKIACPTCQYTLPFLERMYGGEGMYLISQDDAESTRAFHQEFRITIPTLLDDEDAGYPVSNAYQISHVPSLFLIEPDGRVSQSFMGFDKRGMEQLGERLGAEPFRPGEYVVEWKPG